MSIYNYMSVPRSIKVNSASVLHPSDLTKPFQLWTDTKPFQLWTNASEKGFSAVLQQTVKEGCRHPTTNGADENVRQPS